MENKLTLAIDSSDTPLALALTLKNGSCVRAAKKGIKQEEYLFPMLDRLLSRDGASLTDIGRVCVLRGPGRFTGVRIGLTFASVLRELGGSEIWAVTGLEALAFQVVRTKNFRLWSKSNPKGVLACVTHAFRREYYCQLFREENGGTVALEAAVWLAEEKLKEKLAASPVPVFCAGWGENRAALSYCIDSPNITVDGKNLKLDPRTLLAMSAAGISGQEISPIYLKPARFEQTVP